MASLPPVTFADARDELLAKSANKQQNALNHFNHFLKSHCIQIGVAVTDAASIPCHGLPKKTSKKDIAAFWGKPIGSFFSHMGTEARIKCAPNGNRLACQSATQHCSSMKVFFTGKFRCETPIPVFQQDEWKKLREKL